MKAFSFCRELLTGQRRLGCTIYRLLTTKSSKQHKVIVSSSSNIYENLALEDWLFDNTDFQKETVLLLWRNTPCVVFGRHQNPWIECNVPYCEKNKVDLVRRKSGGGTVYHDEGNMNVSFLMENSLYNRKRNLQLVVDALKNEWNVPLTINKRDDIIYMDKYKISGTASKLSGKKTYHHFTLLYNVDKDRLYKTLQSNMEGAISKATQSTKMSVMNLSDEFPDINFTSLVDTISSHFLKDPQVKNVQVVLPSDEKLFPGVEKYQTEMESWEWIFGKTPPFSIHRTFHDPRETGNVLEVKVDIKKGHIHNLELIEANSLHDTDVDNLCYLIIRVLLENTLLYSKDVKRALSKVKESFITEELYTIETQHYQDWLLQCVMETLAIFPD